MFKTFAALVSAVCLLATPASAQVLFFDDFTDPSLDLMKWNVADWQLGRTQLGNSPTLSNNGTTTFASLKLDTFNPGNADLPDAAKLLRGTEIFTKQQFPMGSNGIDIEARVRTNMTKAGALTSFFTYSGLGTSASPAQEIDFEVLTKQLGQNKVLATTWDNWTGKFDTEYNDGVHHRNNDPTASAGQTPAVQTPPVDLTQWTTLRIRWLPTKTEWYINGEKFYETSDAHPTDDMSIRLNFWAPAYDNNNWPAAYDAGLSAVATQAANTSYFYDVDYVKVSAVTAAVPEPTGLLAVAAAVAWASRRARRWVTAAPV